MIRKTAEGYTVYARSGRKMGTYKTLARAHVRFGQLEAFKANRAPMGQMSPTVRPKSKDGKKGYYVRAKSGRSMGWYRTKREAEMRKGQLEAQGAKYFKETSPRRKLLTDVKKIPAYAVIIRAIHERGRTQKEALTELHRRGLWLTAEQQRQARLTPAELHRELGVPGASRKANSWPGQPRRHSRAAKLGHRRTARSPGEWETGASSHGANELILFADNTGELYNEKKRILALLKGAMGRGVYDPAIARSTWSRWLMKAQVRYRREIPNGVKSATGVVARHDAAKTIEERERENLQRGEYNWL